MKVIPKRLFSRRNKNGAEPAKADAATQPSGSDRFLISSHILEWVKVLLPLLLSWPVVVLLMVLALRQPIAIVMQRFADAESGQVELPGGVKVAMGKKVLPPQYRASEVAAAEAEASHEVIDLSTSIGPIADSGPEGATVGFVLKYAVQAQAKKLGGTTTAISAQGIYSLSKEYDEWPGTDYDGSSLSGGTKAIAKVGVYSEEDWPYGAKKPISATAKPLFKVRARRLATVAEILKELRQGNVVPLCVNMTSAFDTPGPKGLITIKLPIETTGGSCFAIVGYEGATAEFRFANHWGSRWADQGFGRIKDTDLKQILMDAYALLP